MPSSPSQSAQNLQFRTCQATQDRQDPLEHPEQREVLEQQVHLDWLALLVLRGLDLVDLQA